jgi:2-oxoglutarate ferredoxin oxidoreductase subunit alpha
MSGMRLLDGSEAIVEAAIMAGLRFYAGYPIAPATELLEYMAEKLPSAGGVCINADTEIEAVNMALGAAQVGARAATGSCGQGLALKQEAIAEAALNETPLVVFNMARNQQDYFQATRGGGWGDYHTVTYAPKDLHEAVELTHVAFHVADKYRVPVIFMGDNLLARTQMGTSLPVPALEPLPAKDWALDGTMGGTGASRWIWTFGGGKANRPGVGPDGYWRQIAEKFQRIAQAEMRHEQGFCDDAETVVVAFGTAGKFVEHVVRELRKEGMKIGFFRPVTLWPFPAAALDAATRDAKHILVFELNAGQMIDDVRLSVEGRSRIAAIGGVSFDDSGLNLGPLLDAEIIRERILAQLSGQPLRQLPYTGMGAYL